MANLTSSQIGKLLNHAGPLWLRDLHLSGADLAGLTWTNLSAANLREADRVYPELLGATVPDGTQRKKSSSKAPA